MEIQKHFWMKDQWCHVQLLNPLAEELQHLPFYHKYVISPARPIASNIVIFSLGIVMGPGLDTSPSIVILKLSSRTSTEGFCNGPVIFFLISSESCGFVNPSAFIFPILGYCILPSIIYQESLCGSVTSLPHLQDYTLHQLLLRQLHHYKQ